MCSLRDTQPLPAVESMADIHATDPEHIYTHRRDVSTVSWRDSTGSHSVPYRPASQWSAAALDRLLADLTGG